MVRTIYTSQEDCFLLRIPLLIRYEARVLWEIALVIMMLTSQELDQQLPPMPTYCVDIQVFPRKRSNGLHYKSKFWSEDENGVKRRFSVKHLSLNKSQRYALGYLHGEMNRAAWSTYRNEGKAVIFNTSCSIRQETHEDTELIAPFKDARGAVQFRVESKTENGSTIASLYAVDWCMVLLDSCQGEGHIWTVENLMNDHVERRARKTELSKTTSQEGLSSYSKGDGSASTDEE